MGNYLSLFHPERLKRGYNMIQYTHKTHIRLHKPWKFIVRNCHPSRNKCIALPHVYTWVFLRVNLIFNSSSSTPLLLHPTYSIPINIILCLFSKHLLNIPHLILIKPTKSTSPIQLFRNFWNHIIPQSLLRIPTVFNSRNNSHMGGYACEVSFPLCCISCMSIEMILLRGFTKHQEYPKTFFGHSFQ